MRKLLVLASILPLLNACAGTSDLERAQAEGKIRECINTMNEQMVYVPSNSCKLGKSCGSMYLFNDTTWESKDNSFVKDDKYIKENVITTTKEYKALTQDEALGITQNWNYEDMKLYDNTDWEVKDYEMNACDALKKLNEYKEYQEKTKTEKAE